jgi:hypothetical protein
MPRLNNKDYTVEELERLIYYTSVIITEVSDEVAKANEIDPVIEELKELIKGSQFTNFEEGERKPEPIPWNFKFEMLISPETIETRNTIRNAMRSAEVNEIIKNRFNAIVREEVNNYISRVKFFMVKGDTNILE